MSEKVKCKKCGGADFNDSGDCRTCRKRYNDAYRAKAAGGGSAVKTKKAKASKVLVVAAAALPALEIQRCYGLKAQIDDSDGDPYLVIQQTGDGDKTDALCLSRLEFRQLIEKFGSWAA